MPCYTIINMKSKSCLSIISSLLFINLFSQSGEWTRMSGNTTPNSTGTYGLMGIPSATNEIPARYGPNSWKDNNGNFWIYGGLSLSSASAFYFGDMWKYNPAGNTWTWMNGSKTSQTPASHGVYRISSPSNTPGYRSFGSVTWTDNNGNLWMFGGLCGMYMNDLWKYSIGSNEWVWIHGSSIGAQKGIYGTKGLPSAANTPGARTETTCSWVDSNGNLWFFGGNGYDANGILGNLNDLWMFNTSTYEWTWVSGSNTGNQPAVYGTMGVASATNMPGGRMVYASWTDNNGDFYLFGGQNDYGTLNDLWKYNIASNMWTWLSGSSQIDNQGIYTSKCVSSASVYPKGKLESRARWKDGCGNFYLYGGSQGLDMHSDLWRYEPANNNWTWVNGSSLINQAPVYGTFGVKSPLNDPGSRSGNVAWELNGELWMFGGANHKTEDTYNDVWKYTPYAPIADMKLDKVSGCEPLTVNFSDNSNKNCNPIKSYEWNFGDPSSGLNNSSTSINPTHIFNNNGVYNITLTVTGCNNEKSNKHFPVLVSEIIKPNLGDDTDLCDKLTGVLLNAGPGATSYNWNDGSNNQTLPVSTPGTYWVKVSNGGCEGADTIVISDNFNFSSPQNYSLCNLNELIIDAGAKGNEYLWSTGEKTKTINIFNAGIYTVTVTKGNCINSNTITVEGSFENFSLFIPNSFTPNGDNLNDTFLAQGYDIENFNMKIFNRWGELIFESDKIENGWDGNYNNNPVQNDLYVCIIKYKTSCNDSSITKKSFVVVLK